MPHEVYLSSCLESGVFVNVCFLLHKIYKLIEKKKKTYKIT